MEVRTISHSEKMKLNTEQIEEIAKAAEKAARRYIASNITSKETEDLEIAIEVESNDELKIDIEIGLEALPNRNGNNELVRGAVEAAHTAIRDELERLRSI